MLYDQEASTFTFVIKSFLLLLYFTCRHSGIFNWNIWTSIILRSLWRQHIREARPKLFTNSILHICYVALNYWEQLKGHISWQEMNKLINIKRKSTKLMWYFAMIQILEVRFAWILCFGLFQNPNLVCFFLDNVLDKCSWIKKESALIKKCFMELELSLRPAATPILLDSWRPPHNDCTLRALWVLFLNSFRHHNFFFFFF